MSVFIAGGLLVTCQVYTLIPLFEPLAAAWGRSVSAITLLPTVYAIAYGIGQVIWGLASDRFGRRLVLTTGLVATGVFTSALATVDSLPAALPLVALQGLVASSFSAAALAYLTARIEPRRTALAVSILTTCFFASAVIGQVASQLIVDQLGWRAVFAGFGGAILVSAAAVGVVVEPAAARASTPPRTAFAALRPLVRNPRIMLAIAASVAVLGSFVGVYAGLELMGPGELRGDGDALLWLRAAGLPALVAVPLVVRRTAGVDPALRCAASLSTAAVALLVLLAVGDEPVAIGGVLLVFVLGIGSTSPAIADIVARESGPSAGAGMGLWGFFLFVGASVGPQLAALLRPAGFDALLGVLAAILLGAALLTLASTTVSRPNLTPPPI